MKKLTVLIASAVLGSSIAAPGWADSNTSPGVYSVHASAIAVAVPFQVETVLLTATLKSGKSRRVLVLDTNVGGLAPGDHMLLRPQVNGFGFETIDDVGNGDVAGINCPSTAEFACRLAAHFWLDLDAAEAAHPGTFIGKPLVIQLIGATNDAGGLGVTVNLSARLDKK